MFPGDLCPGVNTVAAVCGSARRALFELEGRANTLPGTESNSNTSIVAAFRTGSFSFVQLDYYTLVPFIRDDLIFPHPDKKFVQHVQGICGSVAYW